MADVDVNHPEKTGPHQYASSGWKIPSDQKGKGRPSPKGFQGHLRAAAGGKA